MRFAFAIFDYGILNGVVVIKDLHSSDNHSMSVTNDAENVISVIAANNHGLDGLKVIYRDTEGIYDEIIIKDSQFAGFRLLNAPSLKQALINLCLPT
jgi:hypothetical protein